MNKSLFIAEKAMRKVCKPLTGREIIDITKNEEYYNIGGKTPHATIDSNIYFDIRDNPESVFYLHSRKPKRHFLKYLKKDLPIEPKQNIMEKREYIYAIEMTKSSFGETYLKNVKIGYTKNIEKTLSGYKRGSPNCEKLGLWYSNPELKVTDCEKGIHKIADQCGYKRKSETFIFLDDQYKKFEEFVDLLLKRV